MGIFVGGKGLRMGGVAKGNLVYEGRSILERTLATCASAVSASEPPPLVYLVGDASAYALEGVPSLADAPSGRGPMGGLRALLLLARARQVSAVALATDMPYLVPSLLVRVMCEAPEAPALAPREEGRWQPLFARYSPDAVLPLIDAALTRSATSLQVLFDGLGSSARELELSASERAALRDWDRPSDVTSGCLKPPA